MPPRLDLSHSTHAAVMVAPPRINLRRAASYNAYDRAGPVSSTSSRFNFNHLLFSPPPSPSLPALVPRPKKSPIRVLKSRPSRVVRLFVYLTIALSAFYFLAFVFRNRDAMPAIWPYFADDEFEMVGQDGLPDFPTPIVVSDSKGRSKWTVSIPADFDFPLSIQQYSDMSGQCREVSARARDLHHKTPLSEQAMLSYDAPDDCFVDVYEAEKTGLLRSAGKTSQADAGHFVGLGKNAMAETPVCESSMTFVLESSDAGLGNAMMMLWTFYGLAKEQGRAFFIDDSRWAYGGYSDIFQPPPAPECRPPPRHQIVPCPFQARHLVVSAATAKEVFPGLLAKHHRIARTGDDLRDLFELARTGYQALFALNNDDEKYVVTRVADLKEKAVVEDAADKRAPVIGLHIRHGDQHPLEYQYRGTYIPAEAFLESAQHLVEAYYKGTAKEATARQSVTVVASDDPTVHQDPVLPDAVPAQNRIRLASKEAIDQANQDDPTVLHHFVDEAFGWEGGFFAPMFWNLGVNSKNNAANAPAGVEMDGVSVNDEARLTAPPSAQTLGLRSLIGRAYVMDLAVLAGASDSVVCAVSAMGCRLLAVMMAWEDGVDGGGWVNVDGGYGWTGINW